MRRDSYISGIHIQTNVAPEAVKTEETISIQNKPMAFGFSMQDLMSSASKKPNIPNALEIP